MAYQWSNTSSRRLNTCESGLILVCNTALGMSPFDLTILEGHRGEEDQNEMVRRGLSQLPWPEGKHNTTPSKAVDIAPYLADRPKGQRIPWKETMPWYILAGVMYAAAAGGIISLFGEKLIGE